MTTISDAFHAIRFLYIHLTALKTEPNTNERNDQNIHAGFDFVRYQYQKSLCPELLPITSLQLHERMIGMVIATGQLHLTDNKGLDRIANSIKEIQSTLLDMIPVESEEYKKLLKEIPDIRKYTPSTEPTYT